MMNPCLGELPKFGCDRQALIVIMMFLKFRFCLIMEPKNHNHEQCGSLLLRFKSYFRNLSLNIAIGMMQRLSFKLQIRDESFSPAGNLALS